MKFNKRSSTINMIILLYDVSADKKRESLQCQRVWEVYSVKKSVDRRGKVYSVKEWKNDSL